MDKVLVRISDYEILSKIFENKDIVSIDEITNKLEDYYNSTEYLTNKIAEEEQNREENFKRIPVNEQYEIYDRDFMEV